MNHQTTHEITLRLAETQLATFYPIRESCPIDEQIGQVAFQRTVACIDQVRVWKVAGFDCLVSWQYATYLYFLSREVWLQSGDQDLATRIFLLNKALNAVELYFLIDLRDFFLLSHTPGLVFAQATYGNYGIYHQGCTVGRNGEDRPILEEGVVLYPNSAVLGRCLVRRNTVITPGVQLVNQDTPGNCYVFQGANGRPVFKEISEFFADRYFDRQAELVSASPGAPGD